MPGKVSSTRGSFRFCALVTALVATGFIMSAGPAAAQNLVTNPNFDDGLNGYTSTGTVLIQNFFGSSTAFLCGTNCGGGPIATLTQSIMTTPGATYLVSFLAAFSPGNYTASFGTGGFSSQGTSTGNLVTPFPFSFTGIATGTSTNLTFTSDNALAIDNLDVETAPIPTPGAGGLSILAGLVWFCRRAVRRTFKERGAAIA